MINDWHIDPNRGTPGFRFAVCAPYKDGLPGTAILGCFAYRPHAETAMRALAADPNNAAPGAEAKPLAWQASTESRNFSFEAFGPDEETAILNLEATLARHAEQYGLEPNWWKYPHEGACIIEVQPVHADGYRDGEQLT